MEFSLRISSRMFSSLIFFYFFFCCCCRCLSVYILQTYNAYRFSINLCLLTCTTFSVGGKYVRIFARSMKSFAFLTTTNKSFANFIFTEFFFRKRQSCDKPRWRRSLCLSLFAMFFILYYRLEFRVVSMCVCVFSCRGEGLTGISLDEEFTSVTIKETIHKHKQYLRFRNEWMTEWWGSKMKWKT